MNVLIAYATTEGHTEKISRFIDETVSHIGHEVRRHNVSELSGGLSVDDFDKVIIAGSVHSSKHQKDLETFAFANREQLNEMPCLLVSVSLAAAFPENSTDAERYVETFAQDAGLEIADCIYVAGAVKPDHYDWFEESALMEGDLAGHLNKELTEEHEFTDWDALAGKLGEFVSR